MPTFGVPTFGVLGFEVLGLRILGFVLEVTLGVPVFEVEVAPGVFDLKLPPLFNVPPAPTGLVEDERMTPLFVLLPVVVLLPLPTLELLELLPLPTLLELLLFGPSFNELLLFRGDLLSSLVFLVEGALEVEVEVEVELVSSGKEK